MATEKIIGKKKPRENKVEEKMVDWRKGRKKKCRKEKRAGRRFYRIQLYTVITLNTQLNTAHLCMATTRHHTTLRVHNSIQHNSTRHNSTRHNSTRDNSTRHNSTWLQLGTPQLYTATTRYTTTLHIPHGRKVEATIPTVANGISKA